MRVDEETTPNSHVVAFVITGDGRTESKVLSAIAERYNGEDKILLFPKSPTPRKTGLSALSSINIIIKRTGYTRYLFLVDREHFNEEKLHNRLVELFGKYNVEGSNPYRILTDELEVYLVVLGEKAAIEENLAKLINLEVGRDEIKVDYSDVHSLKRQIRTFVKDHGYKSRRRFILSCRLENIEASFKPLVTALKLLEPMNGT